MEISDERIMRLAGAVYNASYTILRLRKEQLRLFTFNAVPPGAVHPPLRGFRAPLRTDRYLIYSSERPTQLRSTAYRYPGLPPSRQRLLPAHQARLLAIEE
jgi:hypothetical protein